MNSLRWLGNFVRVGLLLGFITSAAAQGVFRAHSLPGAYVYEPDGVTPVPTDLGRVEILYNGSVVASGGFVAPGAFSLGAITLPGTAPGQSAVVTVVVSDVSDTSSYGEESVQIPQLGGALAPPPLWGFSSITLVPLLPDWIAQSVTSFSLSPPLIVAGECNLLSATSSSSLPVGFEVLSGPAFMVGDVLCATNSGLLSLLLYQPGNPSGPGVGPPNAFFFPAPFITNELLVLPSGGVGSDLTFLPIPPLTAGGPPAALIASDPSGLVRFSVVSGPGTIDDGNNLYATNNGVIVVSAQSIGGEEDSAGIAYQAVQVGPPDPKYQYIQFGPGPDPTTYSTNPIPINAVALSGLPVSFYLTSGPGAVSGNLLIPTNHGWFEIAAVQWGNSNWAFASARERILVTGLAQTIDFSAPTNLVYAKGELIQLSASASSGLPVTFSVLSGPAALAGSTLYIYGGGPIVVAANQPGDLAYARAGQVTQTIQVSPAAQSISFSLSPTNYPFATTPIPLVATASSGLPVAFSIASGPGTIDSDELTPTNVGTILIVASQPGNSGFLPATPVTNTVVIEPVSQTILFHTPITTTTDVGPVRIWATAWPSRLPVTYALLGGPATLAVDTLTFSGPGVVTVAAYQAGNPIYLPAAQTNTILVQLSQTISLPALSNLVYQTEPIPFAPTASSGLPVQLIVEAGSVALSSNLLWLAGTGTIQILAAQPGNILYAPAASQLLTLDVAPALKLTQAGIGGSNAATLSIFAGTNAPLLLLASPDLTNWTRLGLHHGAGVQSPLTLQVPANAPGAANRFWRVLGP